MLKDPSISRFRSEVIERSINIEWIMNAIISQHYLGKVMARFTLEFLCDEYCSFGLKRRVLEKILADFKGQKAQNLNRLGSIRNCFAHCNQIMVDGPDPTNPAAFSGVVDPRKINEFIDFEKLYKEFTEIAGPLEEYLAGVFKAKGGELKMDEDFKKL